MEDEKLIETLLYKGEGTTLDYKVQQYPHDGASEDAKGELLKDILAFSNAWRAETAYILIGVSDAQELVGLDKNLDDARLQQFINGKTNTPLNFSYRSLTYNGVKLGLYTIPVQERPIFAKQKYGKVLPDTVYVRRGSSTAIAKPDEIAKMGAAASEDQLSPQLQVKLCDTGEDSTHIESIDIEYCDVQLQSYPAYRGDQQSRENLLWNGGATLTPPNSAFYTEFAQYIKFRKAICGFKFEITNSGATFAEDVKIKISAPSSSGFTFLTSSNFPARPRKTVNLLVRPPEKIRKLKEIQVASERGMESATFHIGKIQSGETRFTEIAFFARPPETMERFNVMVFSDQLRTPIQFDIPARISVFTEDLTFEKLTAYAK